jgi:hypothetical protein
MKRLALISIAGLALAGGVAYATIPDVDGVIHACMLKKVGTIRLIDSAAGQSCSATLETPVDWSKQGPQGATGPAGPKGDQGDRGPSDLFHQDWNLDPVELADSGADTPIRSLSVPAGSYLVTAQAELILDAGEPFSSSRDLPGCYLRSGSNIPFADNLADLEGPRRGDIFEVVGSITRAEPGTIDLSCTTGTGSGIHMRGLGQVLALRVATVTHTE